MGPEYFACYPRSRARPRRGPPLPRRPYPTSPSPTFIPFEVSSATRTRTSFPTGSMRTSHSTAPTRPRDRSILPRASAWSRPGSGFPWPGRRARTTTPRRWASRSCTESAITKPRGFGMKAGCIQPVASRPKVSSRWSRRRLKTSTLLSSPDRTQPDSARSQTTLRGDSPTSGSMARVSTG